MNHYPHHIGDFNNATRHLTRVERSLYRDLLELYYDTEQPLNSDLAKLARRVIAVSDEERTALGVVLEEFFVLQDDGWHNTRCDAEIAKYQGQIEQASRAGRASAAKRSSGRPSGDKPALPSGSNARSTPVERPYHQPEPEPEPEPIPTSVGSARTPASAACLAMKAAGMQSVNPANPKLAALLDAGITLDELSLAAADAVKKGKPFAYALASAEGRRRDAATAPLPAASTCHSGRRLPVLENFADRVYVGGKL